MNAKSSCETRFRIPVVGRLRFALVALLLAMTACTNVEEKRIRELLIEKGFGTRAEGNAALENYVAGGDGVVFLVDPGVVLTPGFEQLGVLTAVQSVSLDGTILLPYVGPVQVLGMTEGELKKLVEEQLYAFFTREIRVQARVINAGKVIYAFGEVQSKGRLPMTRADMTLFDAIATIGTTPMANIGRIRLVRPDAENPIVLHFNMREMIETGFSTYNFRLQDRDIIVVPPTFFGALARFVEKLVTPLGVVTSALFSAATLRYSYEYALGDQQDGFFYRF
jgi:protein involved in polysaccharide export with SLBB domain